MNYFNQSINKQIEIMKTILTIGDLRQAIQHLDDHDEVIIEIAPQGFYTIASIDDSLTIISDDLNGTKREVRICI
jgi:hypothetical protein